jgi:hypothetical protein
MLQKFFKVIALAAMVALVATPAQAGITLTSTNLTGFGPYKILVGTDPITQPAYEIDLAAPAPGLVFNVSGGGQVTFNQSVEMAQSYFPPIGTPAAALADDTTIKLFNSGTQAVTVHFLVQYDDYNYPVSLPGYVFSSNLTSSGFTGGASVTSTDTLVPPGSPTGKIIHGTISGDVGSPTLVDFHRITVVPGVTPFQIDQLITVTLPVLATANFELTDSVVPVPEPATLASLVFTALPLAGLAFWRRRKARA